MRTASSDFTTHIGQEVTTLARLWVITRLDGTALRFTDANRPITFDIGDGHGSQTYRCDISFTASAIMTSSSAANAQSVTVEAAMDDAGRSGSGTRSCAGWPA